MWIPCVVAGAVASCASVTAYVPPVEGAVERVGGGRGFDRGTLELGRRHYVRECARCHAPETPSLYTAEEWDDILETMRKKSRLDERDMVAVRAYVMAAREVPPPTGAGGQP